jgi:hypothetical protein
MEYRLARRTRGDGVRRARAALPGPCRVPQAAGCCWTSRVAAGCTCRPSRCPRPPRADAEIAEQVEASDEVKQVVEALEKQYDMVASGRGGGAAWSWVGSCPAPTSGGRGGALPGRQTDDEDEDPPASPAVGRLDTDERDTTMARRGRNQVVSRSWGRWSGSACTVSQLLLTVSLLSAKTMSLPPQSTVSTPVLTFTMSLPRPADLVSRRPVSGRSPRRLDAVGATLALLMSLRPSVDVPAASVPFLMSCGWVPSTDGRRSGRRP